MNNLFKLCFNKRLSLILPLLLFSSPAVADLSPEFFQLLNELKEDIRVQGTEAEGPVCVGGGLILARDAIEDGLRDFLIDTVVVKPLEDGAKTALSLLPTTAAANIAITSAVSTYDLIKCAMDSNGPDSYAGCIGKVIGAVVEGEATGRVKSKMGLDDPVTSQAFGRSYNAAKNAITGYKGRSETWNYTDEIGDCTADITARWSKQGSRPKRGGSISLIVNLDCECPNNYQFDNGTYQIFDVPVRYVAAPGQKPGWRLGQLSRTRASVKCCGGPQGPFISLSGTGKKIPDRPVTVGGGGTTGGDDSGTIGGGDDESRIQREREERERQRREAQEQREREREEAARRAELQELQRQREAAFRARVAEIQKTCPICDPIREDIANYQEALEAVQERLPGLEAAADAAQAEADKAANKERQAQEALDNFRNPDSSVTDEGTGRTVTSTDLEVRKQAEIDAMERYQAGEITAEELGQDWSELNDPATVDRLKQQAEQRLEAELAAAKQEKSQADEALANARSEVSADRQRLEQYPRVIQRLTGELEECIKQCRAKAEDIALGYIHDIDDLVDEEVEYTTTVKILDVKPISGNNPFDRRDPLTHEHDDTHTETGANTGATVQVVGPFNVPISRLTLAGPDACPSSHYHGNANDCNGVFRIDPAPGVCGHGTTASVTTIPVSSCPDL